jgi:hypothetical protein
MSHYHKVSRGECLVSIAAQYCFADYQVLWNHPNNARLKSKRKNPNILAPGDLVFIPDKTAKQEARGTGAQHVFQVAQASATLRIQFERFRGGLLVGTAYTLTVDGKTTQGVTTAEGRVEEPIPPKAKTGELRLEELGITWKLEFGALQPIDTVAGLQARLNNLAYDAGLEDNIKGPITTKAIQAFQKDHAPLAVDGISGPMTQTALMEKYGC